MNNLTVERFNVSGALLAKLFGRRDRERDALLEPGAPASATSACAPRSTAAILFVALGLVAAVGTAVVYFVGGNLAISGTISTGTVVAFMIYVGQIYQPLAQLTNSRVDVLTALVSFERVFEVLDFPRARSPTSPARSTSSTRGRGRVRPRVVPAPAGRSGRRSPSLETPGTPGGDEPSEWILRDVSLQRRARRAVALVGPSGAGKTTIAMLVPRIVRGDARRRCASTATTCATSRSSRCTRRSVS